MYSSFLKARGLNQSAFVIQEAGIQDWGQWIPGARSRRRVQKAIERGQNPKKGASDKRGVSITYRVSLRWRPPLHQLLSSPSSHRASHSSKQRAIRRNKSDRSFDDEKITGGEQFTYTVLLPSSNALSYGTKLSNDASCSLQAINRSPTQSKLSGLHCYFRFSTLFRFEIFSTALLLARLGILSLTIIPHPSFGISHLILCPTKDAFSFSNL